jgi:hypothetical protein
LVYTLIYRRTWTRVSVIHQWSYDKHARILDNPKKSQSQAPVAHTCNPSYSGGDQEDHGSKPAWANSLRDPIKSTQHRRTTNHLRKKSKKTTEGGKIS